MRDKELNIETVLSPAYRQIWDNSLLGVMVLDKEGIVLYVNKLITKTNDLQCADIMGEKMTDFYPVDKAFIPYSLNEIEVSKQKSLEDNQEFKRERCNENWYHRRERLAWVGIG
jgi:PAS domain S-box-containing protein